MHRPPPAMYRLLAFSLLLLACAPAPASQDGGGDGGPGRDSGLADASMDSGTADSGLDGGADAGVDAGVDGGLTAGVRSPPALPVYPRTCPTLTFGATLATGRNTGFLSAGDRRDFVLLVPPSYDPAKRYPVVFGYHWLNASAGSVVRDAELESAVALYEFIAVVPERLEISGQKAYSFDWPFVETTSAPKELTFFDDALACVSQQFSVDPAHVHVFGASAGGLWTTYLSTQPAVDRVASVISISGGLGEMLGVWQIAWVPHANTFPAMVVWGGPNDWLGIDFASASQRYRDALRADRHFVVTCTHTAGHAIPPMPAAPPGGTKFAMFWDFFRDHPYGMPAGASPYRAGGLPGSFPAWCSVAP